MLKWGWLEGEQARIHRRIFGERSLHAADTAGHAIDLIANLECLDIRPHRINHACHVDAKDGRQRMTCVFRAAAANF